MLFDRACRHALVVVVALSCPACANGGAGAGPRSGPAAGPRSRATHGAKVEADGRKRDLARSKESLGQLRKAVDGGEQDVLHAFDVALGKADPMKTKKKSSAEELVTYLRGKKVRLGLGKGTRSRRQTFMLDETAKLEFKDGPGRGLKMQEYREVMGKFEELGMHLQEEHHVLETTNHGLLDLNMAIMVGVGNIYAERQKENLDFDDKDHAIVAELISAQRRVEQLSALATGLETAYHAVIRDNKDPKVIRAYVEETAKGFPTKGEATVADAKAYVASLQRDLPGSKERYEGWVRDLYGEENFAAYQKGIEERFAKVDALLSTPRSTGSASGPPPSNTPPSSTAPSGSSTKPATAKVGSILPGGGGVVDTAMNLLPIDGRAKVALKGVAALAQGDFKGAISAATSLVPDGPLKKGLSIVASLF
jgi:hypothetical protein